MLRVLRASRPLETCVFTETITSDSEHRPGSALLGRVALKCSDKVRVGSSIQILWLQQRQFMPTTMRTRQWRMCVVCVRRIGLITDETGPTVQALRSKCPLNLGHIGYGNDDSVRGSPKSSHTLS
jgi:hypothetical protein